MRVFISGGAKNGKSTFAQRMAKKIAKRNETQIAKRIEGQIPKQNEERSAFGSAMAQPAAGAPLYYVATMRAADNEDDERIKRHRAERDGWGFSTIEQPVDIEKILERCDCGGTFLLDSLTALLANEMFLPPDWRLNERAADKVVEGLSQVLKTVCNIVVVSDFIYSDAVIYDPLTEKYRKFLAQIDRAAVEGCDVVLEAAFANIIVHKGKEEYERFCETLA